VTFLNKQELEKSLTIDEIILFGLLKMQNNTKGWGIFLFLQRFCFEKKRMNVRFFTRQIYEKRLYY
jgi:hypothetical protein